ncbi:MAG: sugar ABC transporter ATP-binding protein [Pirellulaceae bacterium]|nr:sugar ABC transporter ATP-binding protein [Pirellulaceae bacterium]
MPPPLLDIRDISKRFGSTQALEQVSLEVQAGRVLALIGENGAGKSTLLKVLSGAHRADDGHMQLLGQSYQPSGHPHQAKLAGIAMIYQELSLASDLSVEDNILLGQPCMAGGLLLRQRQRDRVRQALAAVGLPNLSPRAIVGRLSVAHQQLIEIARALASNARIILFDEPTSSLPQAEVQTLFTIIRRLKHEGLGIVYISHFLEEVRQIADDYCVLRDGRQVGRGRIADVSNRQIISLMVGRDVDDLYPKVSYQPGEELMRVQNLTGSRLPAPINLALRRGEILGVAGLVGAGRTELVRCLMALDRQLTGQVRVGDRVVGARVRSRMANGLAMLSEDRKGEGLALDLSIAENITLSRLAPYRHWGLLNWRLRRQAATEQMRLVEVKAQSPDQPVGQLSGGNQQKVALARILHQQAQILLLDEPTKGIDVGTKAEIYRMMGQLAAGGKTIVFVSSYLPELLAVCDRIAVMARGQLQEIRAAADWTDEEIMRCAVGGEVVGQSPDD